MMRPRRDRGTVTILELLLAMVLTTILALTLLEAARTTLAANGLARDWADGVLGARRALEAIERDLRRARSAEGERTLALEAGGERIVYALRKGGVLERAAGGRTAPLARDVERFEVAHEGALVRVTIGLRRRGGPADRVPTVATAVRVRAEEAPR